MTQLLWLRVWSDASAAFATAPAAPAPASSDATVAAPASLSCCLSHWASCFGSDHLQARIQQQAGSHLLSHQQPLRLQPQA